MTVRDEWDSIVFNILHHLSLGLAKLHVADNGSTDGTGTLLEVMSKIFPVECMSVPGEHDQKNICSRLIEQATGDGARWIVPIDADEFWDSGVFSLEERIKSGNELENGRRVSTVNYFVPSSVRKTRAGCVLQALWVPEKSIDRTPETNKKARLGGIPISLLEPSAKCFMRADRNLILETGSHHWQGMPPETPFAENMVIRHVPHRHRGIVDLRRKAGERLITSSSYVRGNSWHMVRLIAMDGTGLEREWTASSVQNGSLIHDGVIYPMKRDTRLRDLLRPHISAAKKIYREAGIAPKFRWFDGLW